MASSKSQLEEHPFSEGAPFAQGLTVAVIGARRARQGTGSYLALQAARAGAKVAGVFGTQESTAQEAVDWLATQGLATKAYVESAYLFQECKPDILIVASPKESHRSWLHAALAQGVHVYCEKPLIDAPAAMSLQLLESFATANLVLGENCQWPQVLPAFRTLHPQVNLEHATSFHMRLAPPMRGLQRWQEVLSHPISLLQEVAPGAASVENVAFTEDSADAPASRLCFQYCTLERELACEIELVDAQVFPRPAEFSFDAALCRRVVEEGSYAISFVDGSNKQPPVAIPDPMESALRQFLRRVLDFRISRSAPLDDSIARRQFLLEHLFEVYRETAHA